MFNRVIVFMIHLSVGDLISGKGGGVSEECSFPSVKVDTEWPQTGLSAWIKEACNIDSAWVDYGEDTVKPIFFGYFDSM